MPRVYITFNAGQDDQDSDPLDFCKGCWPQDAEHLYLDRYAKTFITAEEVEEGVEDAGPNGHDHPPYEETEYECLECGAKLTRKDD